MKTAQEIMRFALDNNMEIVSYGLAPNPNGFCFEDHGASAPAKKALSKALDTLSAQEIATLKKMCFD